MTDDLLLTVQVPADEWAYAQRRAAWLEALLLRVVRDRAAFREWYDAGELAALRLPGLPWSRPGITQKARRESWPRRQEKGNRALFHVSALPARAFDALLARILDLPPLETETGDLFAVPIPQVPATLAPNTAPAWGLPLMRLLKSEGDWARAWRALPQHLGADMALPDVDDAARVLVQFGMFPGK